MSKSKGQVNQFIRRRRRQDESVLKKVLRDTESFPAAPAFCAIGREERLKSRSMSEVRSKLIISACVLMLYAHTVSGQTASDIEKKYGKSAKVYPVSEHIWMTPKYGADGQICQASLYLRRISVEANHLGTYMPMWELINVFNEFAPPDTRGAKEEYFGSTQTSGSMAWTTFAFEKVTLSVWISFRFGSVADMEEKGVPLGGSAPVMTTESVDEFIAKNSVHPEIAYIRWNKRKCLGK